MVVANITVTANDYDVNGFGLSISTDFHENG